MKLASTSKSEYPNKVRGWNNFTVKENMKSKNEADVRVSKMGVFLSICIIIAYFVGIFLHPDGDIARNPLLSIGLVGSAAGGIFLLFNWIDK